MFQTKTNGNLSSEYMRKASFFQAVEASDSGNAQNKLINEVKKGLIRKIYLVTVCCCMTFGT